MTGGDMTADAMDEPVLDRPTVDELLSITGRDGLRPLVDVFITTSSEIVGQLQEPQDDLALRELGHSLRGAAANMGANRVSVVARLIEKGTPEQQAEGLAQVKAAYDATVSAFQALLAD